MDPQKCIEIDGDPEYRKGQLTGRCVLKIDNADKIFQAAEQLGAVVIDPSTIKEGISNKGMPHNKEKDFAEYLEADAYDWVSSNADSYLYDLHWENN